MDGKWDICASGHVDDGETAKQALVRECAEEIGVTVNEEDLNFAHLSHYLTPNGGRSYYDIYFLVNAFKGIPRINEPDKCSVLEWFDIYELPQDIIQRREQALHKILDGSYYSEVINGK